MPDLLHYVCDKCKKSFYADSDGAETPVACPWCPSRSISRYGRTEQPRNVVDRSDAARAKVDSQGIEVFTRGIAPTPAGPGAKAVVAWAAFKNGHEIAHHGREAVGLNAAPNAAELTAIVDALQWAYNEGYSGLKVFSNSTYAVNWATGKSTTKSDHILPIQQEALELAKKVCAKFEWIPVEENKAQGICRTAHRKALRGDSSN